MKLRLAVLAASLVLFSCGPDEEEPVDVITNNGATNNGVMNNGTANNGGNPNNGGTNNGGGPNNGGTNNGASNNGGTNNGGSNNGGTNNGTVPVDIPNVDPMCIDGQFTEPLPDPSVDLSPFAGQFSSDDPKPYISAVLEARYPVGKMLVDTALATSNFGDCVEYFLFRKDTPENVIRELSTVVHECGHFADIAASSNDAVYIINETVTFSCQGGSSQFGANPTPARSLLNADAFAASRPPCPDGSFDNCDSYADVYLDGDATDDQFDSGDQGLDMVLEETVQYVNSLAVGYAYQDYYSGQVSERDGIATFLWYLTRYLHLMRTEYSAAYEEIVSDSCWREAILTTWGRAWLYLGLTDGITELGIHDGEILPLVTQSAELLNEIQLIRDRQGCQ